MPWDMLPFSPLSQYPHGLALTPKSSSRLNGLSRSMANAIILKTAIVHAKQSRMSTLGPQNMTGKGAALGAFCRGSGLLTTLIGKQSMSRDRSGRLKCCQDCTEMVQQRYCSGMLHRCRR